MKAKLVKMEVTDHYEDNEDNVSSDSDDNIDEDDMVEADSDQSGDEDTDGLDDEEDEDDVIQEEDIDMAESRKRCYADEDEEPSKIAKMEADDGKLYRLPTVDELTKLRETQTLYHSNLFRMQMEELFLEISMKSKHRHQLNQWLNQFATYVKSLPASSIYQLNVTRWLKDKNICDPLALPDAKGSFQFMAPKEVKFVGSFALGTTVTTTGSVDVMLILPEKIVKYKDYKDGRWLAKRSKYLSWLASHLREKSDIVADVKWTTHLGCSGRPVLQVTPSGGIGRKWKVNLFPVPSSESLKLSFFSPEKWTLSPSWYFGNDAKEEMLKPTPHCNWCCAVDVVMQDHHQLITETLSQHSNMCQGIKLIKIWLAQRGIDKGLRRISGHVVTMLVVHLLQIRKLNSQMSGYQVFRTVILTLESSDWTVRGAQMNKDLPDDVPALDTLHSLYEVVLMDPSGRVNLAANLMSEDYLFVKHEAKLALQILKSSAADSFEFLFMKKVEFFQISDQILFLRMKKKDLRRIVEKNSNSKHIMMDSVGEIRQSAWSAIIKTLKKGLGERVRLLIPSREDVPNWSLDESPPKPKSSLAIGLLIDETSAKALLTKGPSAEDPECENFRSFWGKKSNLRRFQDGSFHEAVLWGSTKQSVGDRRLIPGVVAKYLLNLHFGLKKKEVVYVCSQTESVLRIDNSSLDYEYGTGEEAAVHGIQAFDSLARKLRSLDLPLKVSAVQSTSDVSRHSRVFPPLPRVLQISEKSLNKVHDCLQFSDSVKECPSFNYAIDVNVFLETSGKWPDDLVAIQAIKAEFYKKIATLMEMDKVTAIAFPTFLQIFWEGFIFHVRVCYRREIYLSRLVETSEGVLREEDTETAINLEKLLEIMPRITSALASIQADHPSFGSGVRLAKRWLASQLLLPHIPHMAVELLVAHLYTNPAPYDDPHTPHVVFLRFLLLLASTDWKTTPVLVNLRDSFLVEDVTELNRRFTSERSSLPDMFIATSYELRGLSSSVDTDYRYKLASLWTKHSPSLPILYRCKQLASASLDFCTSRLLKSSMNIKMMFRPCLDDFDVVIRLHASKLSRIEESIEEKPDKPVQSKFYKQIHNEVMPVVMFDASQFYLQELRAAFDHIALFFHDEHGGTVIGVVWKPSALQEQDPKIANFEGHRFIGVKAVKQIPNMEAILSDFEIMGDGLVHSVTVNNKM